MFAGLADDEHVPGSGVIVARPATDAPAKARITPTVMTIPRLFNHG
jgi:hypothetical protein